jgi:ABC-type antimicrobial peptide transport system permease subunit
MMTLERQREFGVMLATGMVRARLQLLVFLESLFIALTGVVMGLLVTLPILFWFYTHPILLTGNLAISMEEMGFEPIIPFSLEPELFVNQLLIVLAILALCSSYPLIRISRLQLAISLKGNL